MDLTDPLARLTNYTPLFIKGLSLMRRPGTPPCINLVEHRVKLTKNMSMPLVLKPHRLILMRV